VNRRNRARLGVGQGAWSEGATALRRSWSVRAREGVPRDGVLCFLAKPFTEGDFLRRIRACFVSGGWPGKFGRDIRRHGTPRGLGRGGRQPLRA
jgi:hypothetical protein